MPEKHVFGIKNHFFESLIFFGLKRFLAKFSKKGSKIQKFDFIFFQNFNFFRIFYYSRALLTTWMADWTLQNINSSIRLAVNSLRKGHLCPPTVKIFFIQNDFYSAPRRKIHFCDPHYLSTADNFYHRVHKSKVNRLWEKCKKCKKMPKIVIFFKKLTSLTSDFIARHNTPTCAWSKFLLKKSEKISKKFERGWLFPKSRNFTPPTGKKCNKEHFNQD